MVAEPACDSPQTRELARRACFDCHSNEIDRRWYTNVAPLLWFIQNEVDEGREELNFLEWYRPQEGDEAATVRDRSMPPPLYQWTRSRLTDVEMEALAAGLAATLGEEGRAGGEDNEDDD